MLQTFTMNRSGGEPVTLGQGFAMLHAGARQTAVLICAPWGYEALCAHKSLRLLADRLAASGFATMRFDYPATGNHTQPAEAISDVEDWISAIQQAAQRLRKLSGASRVVLLGMGLGALLAQQAARGMESVAGIVLLAPPTSGKRYLREVSAWSKLIEQSIELNPSADLAKPISIAGFQLPSAVAATLGAHGSDHTPPARVPHLIVARTNNRGDADLAERLTATGVETTQLAFTGYEDLMSDPTAARTPESVWRSITSWVETTFPEWDLSATFEKTTPPVVEGDGFVETPLRFGPNRALFGVLCTPAIANPESRPVYILVNSGYDPHIGWARSAVEQARFLAAHGVASLRMDCADIGDSPALPGSPSTVLYSDAQQEDVISAVDMLAARGFQAIYAAGRCSGAFAALNAAIADARIKGTVLVNLQRLTWDPEENVDEAIRNAFRTVSSYGSRLLQRETFSKLLNGEINVARTGRSIMRRLIAKAALALAPYSMGWTRHSQLYARVRKNMETLSRRNVAVSFVFSSDDGGLDEMAAYFGNSHKRLASFPNASVTVIEGADHNMTARHPRNRVQQLMLELARFPMQENGRPGQVALQSLNIPELEKAS